MALFEKARHQAAEKLDDFFANPNAAGGKVVATASTPRKRASASSDEDEESEDDGKSMLADAYDLVVAGDAYTFKLDDLNATAAMRAPQLLNKERHLQQVNSLVTMFDTKGDPAILANLFSNRNDLTTALQHDLISAWACKTKDNVPECIMKKLYVLTFMAPDSVLASEASRCALQIFEMRQSAFLPNERLIAKALDYFGAQSDFLYRSVKIVPSSSSPSFSSIFSVESKWAMLTGWLRFIAASYNAHDIIHEDASSVSAYADLTEILKSLMKLSADAEVQARHQHECYLAINAALKLRIALAERQQLDGATFSAISVLEKEVILPIVNMSDMTTVSLSHIGSFLSPADKLKGFATAFVQACLCSRFRGDSLPWDQEILPDEGHEGRGEVSAERLSTILETITAELRKASNATLKSQLVPKFASFATLITLLHTLCTASGAIWKKATRTALREACEELKDSLEKKLGARSLFMVAETSDRLDLIQEILTYHDQSSRGGGGGWVFC